MMDQHNTNQTKPQGHVTKAVASLRAALQWRQEFDVSALLQATTTTSDSSDNGRISNDDENHDHRNNGVVDSTSSSSSSSSKYRALLERENATGKIYVRGYDKEGRAMLYLRPGRENTCVLEDQMKHLVWNLEKAIACTRHQSQRILLQQRRKQKQTQIGDGDDENVHDSNPFPPPLEKVNLLIDYEGFTLQNAPSLTASRFTLDVLQKYYPERLHRAYVLNPPWIFSTFWTLIQPFIHVKTKEKIVFCSTPSAMSSTLHERMNSIHHLEPVALGTATKEFDSQAYLNLPFHVSFDEPTEGQV